MTHLATLTRPDGATAELHEDGYWYATDSRWADLLNLKYDPALERGGGVGGMPAYVHTVAAAAEQFGCTARYPWSGSKPIPGAAY